MESYLLDIVGNSARFKGGNSSSKNIETVTFSTGLNSLKTNGNKNIPLLAGPSCKKGEYIQIFSGTPLTEFVKIIKEHGGTIY